MQLDKITLDKFKKNLLKMAQAFPDYELDDIQYFNKLLAINNVNSQFIQDYFFTYIDTTENQHYLTLFSNICLQHDFMNLAKSLLEFCLVRNVLSGEIYDITKLVENILVFIIKYKFTEYIDIERQSQRVRFIYDSNYFSIYLDRIDENNRTEILKLLHEVYFQKILESTATEEIILEKYDNILSLIRTLDDKQKRKTRWSRFHTYPDLKYSPKLSQDLFSKIAGAAEFDEMVWRNFNLLLLPAFGMTTFNNRKIEITNEGNGSILNPRLEIRVNEELLVKKEIFGTVSAGEVAIFELNSKDIRSLGTLNPNIKNTNFHLSFRKYGDKNFDFIRSIETIEILNWIRSQGTPLIEIHDSKDLFELAKDFIRQIQHAVQEDDGYMSLTTLVDKNRVLRSEKDIQIVLKQLLEPKCELYDIELDRESLTGRGPLDFKLSIGSSIKCLMEIKLWDSQKLEHGLTIQLPTYLISDKTKFGLYIPIAIDPNGHEEKLTTLKKQVVDVNTKHDVEIEVMDIKAWKLESASKVKDVSDRTRY